jgi:hypothetical protein
VRDEVTGRADAVVPCADDAPRVCFRIVFAR